MIGSGVYYACIVHYTPKRAFYATDDVICSCLHPKCPGRTTPSPAGHRVQREGDVWPHGGSSLPIGVEGRCGGAGGPGGSNAPGSAPRICVVPQETKKISGGQVRVRGCIGAVRNVTWRNCLEYNVKGPCWPLLFGCCVIPWCGILWARRPGFSVTGYPSCRPPV